MLDHSEVVVLSEVSSCEPGGVQAVVGGVGKMECVTVTSGIKSLVNLFRFIVFICEVVVLSEVLFCKLGSMSAVIGGWESYPCC